MKQRVTKNNNLMVKSVEFKTHVRITVGPNFAMRYAFRIVQFQVICIIIISIVNLLIITRLWTLRGKHVIIKKKIVCTVAETATDREHTATGATQDQSRTCQQVRKRVRGLSLLQIVA